MKWSCKKTATPLKKIANSGVLVAHLWAVMTNKVYEKGQNQLKSLPQLQRRITKAWKSLDSKLLRKPVHQMLLRAHEIVKKGGGRVSGFKQHCECRLRVE